MAKIIDGVAFITEAGSGFGQSAAYSLAQHGVRQFALVDSNEAGLQETAATLSSRHGVTEVLVLPTASGDEKAAEAAVQDAAARFGRIDFAINNAGFGGPMSGSPDTAPAAFEQHLAQNVTGPWLWQRAQIRQMLRQPVRDNNPRYGRGSIVHVCSVHAFAASPPQFAAGAYVAGRHAVLGLTRSEGVLYAPQGIRINALCPGYTASPLIESSEQLKKTISDLVRERVPVGRLAAPEEVADAVVFLASPMSSYMYGQALVLDGLVFNAYK